MIAVLHYYGSQATVFGIKNVSVNDNGFCCELHNADRNIEVIDDMRARGLEANPIGILITVKLTGFTVFEDSEDSKQLKEN